MITYHDFAPTAFDPAGHALPDRQDWLVFPISRTRDTDDPIDVSNWRVAVAAFKGVSPEGRGWEIHRFGHWGPGWFEIILVNPRVKKCRACAEDMEKSIANYPILDEGDFSEAESESEQQSWEYYARSDFQKALAKSFLADDGSETIASQWVADMTTKDIDHLRYSIAEQITNKYPESHGSGDWGFPIDEWVAAISIDDLPSPPPMPILKGCEKHHKPTFGCTECIKVRDSFKPYMGEEL
jgi:RNA binding exosome subunit